MIDLSIVTTLYYSAPYVEEFHKRISETLEKTGDVAEIIFVNDGSPDNAVELCRKLIEKDNRVIVIDLSRNFGHHKALYAGIAHARGHRIFLIDCDLEEPPELLKDFSDQLEVKSVDVVFGLQKVRKGRFFERWSGALFYRVFNFLSDHAIPENLSTVRLMTRRYIDGLLLHSDRALFLPGLFAITGFEQIGYSFEKGSKTLSSYSLFKKLSMFLDSLSSFSVRPLLIMFYIGLFISISSFIMSLLLIVMRVFFVTFNLGWPTLIISIWFLGGFIIFSIGLIGIYLSRIMLEVKERPLYVVKKVYTANNTADY